MKINVLLLSSLLLSAPNFAASQKSLVNEFNGVAQRNKNGENLQGYIELTCGLVTEDVSFTNDDSGETNLILEVDSDMTGHASYKGNIYAEKMDDNMTKKIGWEYYFNAPRGQVVVSLLNNGLAYTDIDVLHGEGYRDSHLKCVVMNVINNN